LGPCQHRSNSGKAQECAPALHSRYKATITKDKDNEAAQKKADVQISYASKLEKNGDKTTMINKEIIVCIIFFLSYIGGGQK
jgi:hypothetical protein